MASRIGVLTVSDTRSLDTDLSGPAVVAALQKLGFVDCQRLICVDETEEIRSTVLKLCETCSAVFTTGGTGFATRDVTPEAIAPLLDRRADSLSELMRLKGLERTPFSHLSRGISGLRGKVLIVNLPGSPSGARDGIEAIGHLIEPILSSVS